MLLVHTAPRRADECACLFAYLPTPCVYLKGQEARGGGSSDGSAHVRYPARSRSLCKKAIGKCYVGTFFLAYGRWDVTYMLACLESGSCAWSGGTQSQPGDQHNTRLKRFQCSSLKRTETGGPRRALNSSR